MVLKFSINYFIYFATIATVVPYLQQILKMQGFRAYEIGLLLGIYEITGVFGPLLVGWFADKIGKYRIILLILAVGSSISFLFFIFDIGFITAALVLILFGMMYRPIASLTDALASRTLPFAIRQYGYARIWGSIGFVGISFFYQIWGFLDTSSPERVIFIFLILMGLLFFSNLTLPVISGASTPNSGNLYPNSKTNEKQNLLKIIKSMPMPFWIGISAAFIIKMSMSGYYSFFSIYLNEIYKINSISGIWGLGALAEIPVVLWGSRFVVRYGVGKMLGLAAIGTVIRFLIYAIAPPLPFMLIAQLFHALSFGLLHITIIVLINNMIPEKSRALSMAIFGGLSYGLAGFIGSSLSGLILETSGFSVMYLFCALISFGAVLLVVFFRKVFN
ncbi:MAG: MFS transporter [Spirochaetia bacterium]|nr:MFS transporter [Spirochaetia bacterium]